MSDKSSPFDNLNSANFGPEQRDDSIFNEGGLKSAQEQEQEQAGPAEQEQVGPGPAPDSVDVQIGDKLQKVTDIKTDGPPGSVGSAILDGKKYVVLEADKYQATVGGRKSKKRATKRSVRKSSKSRKSGRKGRR